MIYLTNNTPRDGLGEITQSHPELNVDLESFSEGHPQLELVSDKSGIDVALDLIRSEPARSITYVALGPLTNLARMLRVDANCVRDRIGQVVAMGGALDVPGNTSPVAECVCHYKFHEWMFTPYGSQFFRGSIRSQGASRFD